MALNLLSEQFLTMKLNCLIPHNFWSLSFFASKLVYLRWKSCCYFIPNPSDKDSISKSLVIIIFGISYIAVRCLKETGKLGLEDCKILFFPAGDDGVHMPSRWTNFDSDTFCWALVVPLRWFPFFLSCVTGLCYCPTLWMLCSSSFSLDSVFFIWGAIL